MWVRPTQTPSDEVQVFYLGARAAVSHVGAVLGERYELLEVLGCGGTAAVYRALDRRTKAAVAVKVLHAGAREMIGAFFQQEGRLTARISSPHLVRAHDFGEDDGRLFIVFDVVPGESLASMFYGRVMPWRELGPVVLHVLDALAALHRLGIVHRDVKPDNVYVGRKLGGELHATLLDLGFALVPPERRLTISPVPSRLVFGTEGFIAPELLAGCPPEPRCDLYSVGALMYTLLTAQPVPDISACPEMAIPPPRAFLPTIPRPIEDVVMRALSDVEARFADVAQMAAAIRAAMIAAEDDVDRSIAEPAAELPTARASASVSAGPVAVALPTLSVSADAARSTADLSPTITPAGDTRPSAVELRTASGSTGAAGSPAVQPAVSAPAGDVGLNAAEPPASGVVGGAESFAAELPPVVPSIGAASSPNFSGSGPAVRVYSRMRAAAACLTAALVGAGSMYAAMVAAPPGAPHVDVSTTACGEGPATPTATFAAAAEVDRLPPFPLSDAGELRDPAAARVDRATASLDAGEPDDAAAGPADDGRLTAGDAAIPARGTSQPAELTPPRRTRMKRTEQTFEQAMTRLETRARACAKKAGIAEAPQSVRVRGDTETGEVQSVLVINMSQEHPFARCIAEVIREAGPPLRMKGNSFTFFSRGGSQ